MKIALTLYATLRSHLKVTSNGKCDLTLEQGSTVQNVLDQLHIPHDLPMIILINGVQKGQTDSLHDGDSLSVFPPIAGG